MAEEIKESINESIKEIQDKIEEWIKQFQKAPIDEKLAYIAIGLGIILVITGLVLLII